MNDKSVEKFKSIIEKIKPGVQFDLNKNLEEDMAFDSLDLINFYFEIERIFKIKLSEDDIAKLNGSTLSNIIQLVAGKEKE